jgi:hypothetical protein
MKTVIGTKIKTIFRSPFCLFIYVPCGGGGGGWIPISSISGCQPAVQIRTQVVSLVKVCPEMEFLNGVFVA